MSKDDHNNTQSEAKNESWRILHLLRTAPPAIIVNTNTGLTALYLLPFVMLQCVSEEGTSQIGALCVAPFSLLLFGGIPAAFHSIAILIMGFLIPGISADKRDLGKKRHWRSLAFFISSLLPWVLIWLLVKFGLPCGCR